MVMVVTQEKPGGQQVQVLAGDVGAEGPEAGVEVGDPHARRGSWASLRMNHLAGTRSAFAVPCSDVRAPTTWS